jgi:hypothetical protein
MIETYFDILLVNFSSLRCVVNGKEDADGELHGLILCEWQFVRAWARLKVLPRKESTVT